MEMKNYNYLSILSITRPGEKKYEEKMDIGAFMGTGVCIDIGHCGLPEIDRPHLPGDEQ
jgi:hypothetical protein